MPGALEARIAGEQFRAAKDAMTAAAIAALHGAGDPEATGDALRALELARQQLAQAEA